MTAMRSERHGPAPEKLSEVDQAASTFEGEIREFIRRDVAFLRRPQQPEAEPGADNVNALIKRVSGNALDEIDRVILELRTVRDMLRNEGERVTREVAGFASLNHAAMTSMKIIADSLTQWRNGPPRVTDAN
ncbi:MAG TPA: hypothetical protein VHD14_11885 [Pseudolabrys sp.]|nr:hypothetical protein [Pseudolabrys sp.]